jgi:hypothetical protein
MRTAYSLDSLFGLLTATGMLITGDVDVTGIRLLFFFAPIFWPMARKYCMNSSTFHFQKKPLILKCWIGELLSLDGREM